MKKLLLPFVPLLCLITACSSPPSIQWQKTIKELCSIDYILIETKDGGCIIADNCNSCNENKMGENKTKKDIVQNECHDDYWIVKLGNTGDIQWKKSFGGTNPEDLKSIEQTSDGGFIIGGDSYSNNGDITEHHGYMTNSDYWVVKLDANGNLQWQKSLGGTDDDNLVTILQTSDKGYIIGGYSYSNDGDITEHHGSTTNSDYWVVKLDTTGNIQWQKSLGGTDVEFFKAIQQTDDRGYIVGGDSRSNDGDVIGNHGQYDYWVVKLDLNGNIKWQKSLGGADHESLTSVQQALDKGYIIAGNSNSNNDDVAMHYGTSTTNDSWIVKLDKSGVIQWQKSLGSEKDDKVNTILQTNDKGYIVAGNFSNEAYDPFAPPKTFKLYDPKFSFYDGYWIIKLNEKGNVQWLKSYGGKHNEILKIIQKTTDGGYIIGSWTDSDDGDVTGHHGGADYWIVKINTTGNLQWQKSLGGTSDDKLSSLSWTTDGGYIIGGVSESYDGDIKDAPGGISQTRNYWIVKLTADAPTIN